LISGIAVAIKSSRPDVRVIGVEPALAGDLADGFRRGAAVSWSAAQTGATIADGLRTPRVGTVNWPIIHALVDEMVTVTEAEIVSAVRSIAFGARLVTEPSGAVATAWCLAHLAALEDGATVAIVSGGDADPGAFQSLLR